MPNPSEATRINKAKLADFVSQSLGMARTLTGAGAARSYLQERAGILRHHLDRLAQGKRPLHLIGLTAFDLSDAADELEGEAARRGR